MGSGSGPDRPSRNHTRAFRHPASFVSSAERGFRGRGNLMIVDTSGQPGALDVLPPLGVFGSVSSATILRRCGRVLKGPIPVLADALHTASQTVTVSQSFHTVS